MSNKNRIIREDIENRSKDFLIEYILRLDIEWAKIQKENDQLKKKVLELEKSNKPTLKAEIPKQIYNKQDTWNDKFIFLLKEKGKPMSTREIDAQILLYEPEIKFKWADSHNQLSQLLNRAWHKGILSKEKDTTSKCFYYLA